MQRNSFDKTGCVIMKLFIALPGVAIVNTGYRIIHRLVGRRINVFAIPSEAFEQ